MTKKHLFSRLLKKAILMALWTKAGICDKACPERSRTGSLLEQSLPRTPSRPKTSVTSVISVAKNPFNQRNSRLMNYLCAYKAPFCAFLWLKNPFNQRNSRLMNYLHAFGIFTTVERALQIRLFMQNEPNFPKSQMNVNKVLSRDYEKRTLGQRGKNEPKTNPIKANQTQFILS